MEAASCLRAKFQSSVAAVLQLGATAFLGFCSRRKREHSSMKAENSQARKTGTGSDEEQIETRNLQ